MIYDKTMPHPGKGAQTWGKAAQFVQPSPQPSGGGFWGSVAGAASGMGQPSGGSGGFLGGMFGGGPSNTSSAVVNRLFGSGSPNMGGSSGGFLGGMMGGKQPSPLNAAMVKQRTIGSGVKQPVMNQPTRTITTDPRNQPAPYGSGARLDRGAAPPTSYNRDRFEQAMQNYDDVVAAGPSHPLYRDLVVGGTHYWKDLGLSSAGGGPDGRGFYDKQAARQYALDKWGPSGFTGGAGPSSGSSGAYGLLGALNQQRIR